MKRIGSSNTNIEKINNKSNKNETRPHGGF